MLSGHQPVYLPGTILFNKIALSDVFMFVGHCQYTPKSWHSHNYIRTGKLSVPVHKGPSINETNMSGEHWKGKHIKSIVASYRKYPFFEDYFPELQQILFSNCCRSLGHMNIELINTFAEWLGIDTLLVDSRQYKIEGNKTDMLISMCKAVGADEYLSNEGSRDYVDEQQMAAAGIKHRWQKFTDPDYGQRRLIYDGKEQPLSVLDLIFSKGPEAGKIVREAGYVE